MPSKIQWEEYKNWCEQFIDKPELFMGINYGKLFCQEFNINDTNLIDCFDDKKSRKLISENYIQYPASKASL